VFCALLVLCSAKAQSSQGIQFEDSVAAIFEEHCVECHSPGEREGGLDLSSAAGVVQGGDTGPVFVAAAPHKSHLLELVSRGEMPKDRPRLAASQVKQIQAWIADGAQFRNPPQLAAQVHQHDVLPIMLLRCTACHGSTLKQGELDLRTPLAMRQGGKSGPAFQAGDPDGSLMIQRIDTEACPPQDLLLKYFVKRPTENERETLRQWIADGAPELPIEPDVATSTPDPLVSDADRQHWAFREPHRDQEAGGVDVFIHRRLQEAGLGFAPEADRDTLIRRAYLDLTGLPPSPRDWAKWRDLEDSQWYPLMIEELLASPQYGERWGRYWLDLAGYSDSEGGTSADPLREVAWKYRDYVIRAFNQDKPYDEFLIQQIAGDELIDVENAPEVTDSMVENLVATGFLRMGIDQTGSRTMNFVPERLGVIADAMTVLGSGVMGLTLDCARCHSHKYDPIPHRDYYRMKAIFQGALDEHNWMSFKTRKLELGTPSQEALVSEVNPPLEAEAKQVAAALKKAEVDLRNEILLQHCPDLTEAERGQTLVALRKADNQLTRTEKILVERFLKADLLPDSSQPDSVLAARSKVAALQEKEVRLRERMSPPLTIRALWDRGDPSPTYVLRRGEHNRPGLLVGPGVPSVLTDGQTPFVVESPFPSKTGRRLSFAKWLVREDHPLTARVMVNRIWFHHFGNGLVPTVDNFGIQGEPPTHPELLDWLAIEFVKRGWSMKEMHRLIMNSRTYRQSSRITPVHQEKDPDNELWSRMPLRRMDAEALRDSLLFVSGKLDLRAGGVPDPVVVDRDGLVSVRPTADGKWRRSVYSQYRRTEIPTMMDTFDYPEMGPNCITRSVSTVSPQALLLRNNKQVRHLAGALAERVQKLVPDGSQDAIIDTVYRLSLSRLPSPEEKVAGLMALQQLSQDWEGDPNGPLESYCHTILNSAAFLYID